MIKKQPKVGLIWATSQGDIFSKNGSMPWHTEEYKLDKPKGELSHFKDVTQGSTIVMGRKTWDSLQVKPLLGRKNVIISSTLSEQECQVSVKTSLEQALIEEQELGNDVWIIGGRKLLLAGFDYAEHLWHTKVQGLPYEIHHSKGEFLKINYRNDKAWREVAGISENNWEADYWQLRCPI